MGDQLGRWNRLVAIARLEEISDELGMISSWLSRSGEIEDKAGILVEDARKDLDTACWALSKPAHARPGGWPAGHHASPPARQPAGPLPGPVTGAGEPRPAGPSRAPGAPGAARRGQRPDGSTGRGTGRHG